MILVLAGVALIPCILCYAPLYADAAEACLRHTAVVQQLIDSPSWCLVILVLLIYIRDINILCFTNSSYLSLVVYLEINKNVYYYSLIYN